MSAPSSHPKQPPSELAAPCLDPDRTVAGDLSQPAGPDTDSVPTMPQLVNDARPPEEQRPTLPGYQILEVLGRGGMGVVYKARQVGLGRMVALKMILGGTHAGPEDMVRFLAEAEAVAQLQHTNIVQIYQIGKHGDVPFFSLEYVDGGSLAQRLNGTPQPPREAARLLESLARALHAAHQKGIVHRDLKPGNILLASEGDKLLSGGRQPPENSALRGRTPPAPKTYAPRSPIVSPRSRISGWPSASRVAAA
jgi:serine/threonine protein kinase